jgi:hypothetical protein|tara:strand:+ start:530 stop:877 length:348 start_codon:yes stop_codon:yes gene_type:complete
MGLSEASAAQMPSMEEAKSRLRDMAPHELVDGILQVVSGMLEDKQCQIDDLHVECINLKKHYHAEGKVVVCLNDIHQKQIGGIDYQTSGGGPYPTHHSSASWMAVAMHSQGQDKR